LTDAVSVNTGIRRRPKLNKLIIATEPEGE
jgi:hypothetical protein